MCVLSRAAHVRAPLRHRGAVLDQAATAVILDLQRVRSAIARNACKHLLSDDALEPPPNLLKAVACIRNGKWCSLHWRYLIDLEGGRLAPGRTDYQLARWLTIVATHICGG